MNKRNVIWIAILAILIVIFLFSRGKENIEKRIDLFKFKEKDVVKIEFIQPADTLVIALNQDTWRIEHPLQIPARESQIERFFTSYLSLTTSKIPISESIDRQDFYNVDMETALQVLLYGKNNKLLSRVFLGRSTNNFNIAYVRRADDNRIYQIENVFNSLNPTLSSWREDRIVSFDQNEVKSIYIGTQTDSYTLQNDVEEWTLIYDESASIIPQSDNSLSRLLSGLTNLRTTVFFDDEWELYEAKFSITELEILVELFSGENVHLKMARNDENSYVLQKNDEQNMLFRLTTSQFNSLNIDPSAWMQW